MKILNECRIDEKSYGDCTVARKKNNSLLFSESKRYVTAISYSQEIDRETREILTYPPYSPDISPAEIFK